MNSNIYASYRAGHNLAQQSFASLGSTTNQMLGSYQRDPCAIIRRRWRHLSCLFFLTLFEVARHSEQSLLHSPFVLERYTVNGICLKVKIFLHAGRNAKSLSAYNLLIMQPL